MDFSPKTDEKTILSNKAKRQRKNEAVALMSK